MAALKQLSSPTVRVRRDGALHESPARDLVPGDIVLIEAGNVVPADLRLVDCVNLGVMEAALTGESEAVRKQTEAFSGERLPLGDRTNLVYLGTAVVHGRGAGVVIGTGMGTELGKIARMIQGMEAGRTPLQRKIAQVGKHLSIAGFGAALALLATGLLRGESFTVVLLTAVSLLVAVVPEGLPAVEDQGRKGRHRNRRRRVPQVPGNRPGRPRRKAEYNSENPLTPNRRMHIPVRQSKDENEHRRSGQSRPVAW